MLRNLFIALAISIAIPVVFVPCWIYTHTDDLPAVDDADLAVQRSEIAPGNNGLDHFVEAANALDWPEGADERLQAIREGTIADLKWVEQLAGRNRRAMENVRRGIEAPQFALPRYVVGESDSPVDKLLAIQRLVKLAGARARVHSLAGEHREAVETALLGVRVSRRLSSAEGIHLLGMMFANVFSSIGAFDLEDAVRGASLTRDEARALIDQLEATRWTGADWARVWAAEYEFVSRGLIEAMEATRPGEIKDSMQFDDSLTPALWKLLPEGYLWQPRRTISAWAEHTREQQRRSASSCREAYGRAASDRTSTFAVSPRSLLSPNAAGATMLAIFQPTSEGFDMKRCHAESKISLLEALIAVKAHEREHGSLPARLEDLVPDYLSRVPEDRFAGAPLRYSRERKAVWSVGEDLADAGGGEKFDLSDATEPALSLAF